MKTIVVLFALATAAYGASIIPPEMMHTAWGYHERFGVPLADQLRAAEAAGQTGARILGGQGTSLTQLPYQAGLLIDIHGIRGHGLCGGTLLSVNRVLTAAHCWFDGQHQGWRVTVVLGSTTIFSGGTRSQSINVLVHNNWNPLTVQHDLAVIRLSPNVVLNNNIRPIALPIDAELEETYVNEFAVASGYGHTSQDGILVINQNLNHVAVPVISNKVCRSMFPYPIVIRDSTLCTSGANRRGPCLGDTGGPLTVVRNGQALLIGVTSFTHPEGCGSGNPTAYSRVTYYRTWIRANIV